MVGGLSVEAELSLVDGVVSVALDAGHTLVDRIYPDPARPATERADEDAVCELALGVSLLREASPRTRDRILSAGERASASVVAAADSASSMNELESVKRIRRVVGQHGHGIDLDGGAHA